MIRYYLLQCITGMALKTYAQKTAPVNWHFAVGYTTASEGQLVFNALLDEGWHIYSQMMEEGGPLPTTFRFFPSFSYTCVGNVTEASHPVKQFDPTFLMDITSTMEELKCCIEFKREL